MKLLITFILIMNNEIITDLFFDLDHTLWDFEKNSALTFKKIFNELKIEVPLSVFLEKYNPVNHAYWKLYREDKITQIELRLKRLEKTFEAIEYEIAGGSINQISDKYIEYLPTFPHLFPETIIVLNGLQKKYNMHIITNGFEEVQHPKIERSGLMPFFKHIITADEVGVKKPNPIIFEHALKKTNTLPQNTLMIGDSLEADILGAINLGMQAIHFNSHHEPFHEHCLIINKLEELKTLL